MERKKRNKIRVKLADIAVSLGLPGYYERKGVRIPQQLSHTLVRIEPLWLAIPEHRINTEELIGNNFVRWISYVLGSQNLVTFAEHPIKDVARAMCVIQAWNSNNF